MLFRLFTLSHHKVLGSALVVVIGVNDTRSIHGHTRFAPSKLRISCHRRLSYFSPSPATQGPHSSYNFHQLLLSPESLIKTPFTFNNSKTFSETSCLQDHHSRSKFAHKIGLLAFNLRTPQTTRIGITTSTRTSTCFPRLPFSWRSLLLQPSSPLRLLRPA